ncbi:MAG: hypothetical protein ABIP42_08730, partial [Planctomycetota bacterium]
MFLIALLFACLPQFPESVRRQGNAQDQSLAGFTLERRALEKSPHVLRRVARPGMYFDAVGNRSFTCGREDGSFESWVWPWQIFHDAHFSFRPEKALEPFEL